MGGVLKNVKQKAKKLDVVVVRMKRTGIMGNARPCRNCVKMMKNLGIRRIYYSSGFGDEIMNENIEDIISIQDSSAIRYFSRIKLNYPLNDIDYYKLVINKYFPEKIKKESLDNFITYYLNEWIKPLRFKLGYKLEENIVNNTKITLFKIYEIITVNMKFKDRNNIVCSQVLF